MSVPYFFVASTNFFVKVAVAHIRCMKLRAVRSAAKIDRAFPRNARIVSCGFTTEPSLFRIFT